MLEVKQVLKKGGKSYALVKDQGQRDRKVEEHKTLCTQRVRQNLDSVTKI